MTPASAGALFLRSSWCLFLWLGVCVLSLPSSEYASLQELYDATNGLAWTWKTPYGSSKGYPWVFAASAVGENNPCNASHPWQGITCSSHCALDSSSCTVKYLTLSNYALTGPIPSSIANLTRLQQLQLYNNHLTGSIPDSISSMKGLLYFSLSINDMSGPIPSSLSALSSLQYLLLNDNDFTGTLPEALSRLTNLLFLQCNFNRLVGTIPSAISVLTKMQSLSLNFNQLSGTLPDVSTMTNLQVLDLHSNLLHGPIPASYGQLLKLTQLYLQFNNIAGRIPISIGNLTFCQSLFLNNNQLTGNIPSTLSALTKLTSLQLNVNQLTGTVPSALQRLHFQHLDLSFNSLSGSLPVWLNTSSSLTAILFHYNLFTGSLPSSWSELSELQQINVENNLLQDTIPLSWTQFPELTWLSVSGNFMTGSLPAALRLMSTVRVLYIDANYFSGSLPTWVCSWNALESLNATLNLFHGQIPNCMGELESVINIYFAANVLSGTIPPSLGNLTNLQYLLLGVNGLTGSLPQSFAIPTLRFFQVLYNQLTGPIPNCFQYLTESLQGLQLYGNAFTGRLPDFIANWTAVNLLQLEYNFFTGSFPYHAGQWPRLQLLTMSDNLLTGSIPTSVGQIATLQVLQGQNNQLDGNLSFIGANQSFMKIYSLDHNHFTGSVPLHWCGLPRLMQFSAQDNYLIDAFPQCNSSTNTSTALINLQMSNNFLSGPLPRHVVNSLTEIVYLQNNFFSGTIPEEWFARDSSLQFLILAINCLGGEIPQSICNSAHLVQLSLDGLHSATSCEKRMLPLLPSSGFTSTSGLHGSIPSCLLSFTALEMLYLSGNELSGTLPATSAASPRLSSAVLSNNRLSGTINSQLYGQSMDYLDLSFNRFRDHLPSNIFDFRNNITFSSMNAQQNLTVKLKVNRISGQSPEGLRAVSVVDVLDGNMFACDRQRNDLPLHDPAFNSYSCGSDSTNNAVIAFVCAMSVFALVRYWCEGWAALGIASLMNDGIFSEPVQKFVFDFVSDIVFRCVVFSAVVLLPLYLFFSVTAGSYQYKYIWSLSALYLSGIWPAVVLFCALAFISAFVTQSLLRIGTEAFGAEKSVVLVDERKSPVALLESETLTVTTVSRWRQPLFLLALLGMDVAIVMTVNSVFVAAVVSNTYTPSALALLSFAVSVFKFLFNLLLTKSKYMNGLRSLKTILTDRVLVGVALFNNIAVPFIAEAFVSSNCFLYVVQEAPEVVLSIAQVSCLSTVTCTTLECVTSVYCPTTLNTDTTQYSQLSYVPPFHYSFQCSSSLMSAFIPVFAFRYILSAFGEPILLLILQRLQVYHALPMTLIKQLPTMLRVLVIDESHASDETMQSLPSNTMSRLRSRMCLEIVTDIAVLLSFGMLFPPLCWIIALSLIKTAIWFRAVLDRVTPRCASNIDDSSRVVQCELLACKRDMLWGMMLSIIIASIFWSFALFDTLADAVGSINALWIVVVMSFCPFLSWFAMWQPPHIQMTTRDHVVQSVEMTTTSSALHENSSL